MPADEELVADLGSPIERPGTIEKSRDEQQTSVASVMGDRLGPRAVSSRDREQAVRQLAASLTAALAQFLLDGERQVLNRAESMHASTLADLERQRASVESLIGMFAERLQQQEDGLSSLQEELEGAPARLDRHAEAIRSLSEGQAQHDALLDQLRHVVRLLAEAVKSPAEPPRISV